MQSFYYQYYNYYKLCSYCCNVIIYEWQVNEERIWQLLNESFDTIDEDQFIEDPGTDD